MDWKNSKSNLTMNYRIKSLSEAFFNPFEEDEEDAKMKKSKEVIPLSDTSDILSPRKEVFDINRVEYSKRPNGEFVIYAKTSFSKGEIVEICPVIIVGVEAKAIPNLKNYIFEIEKIRGTYGVVLGYGSLYKHAENPNIQFAYNRTNRQMYFIAARDIRQQEELSINYGKEFWDEFATYTSLSKDNKPVEKSNESSSVSIKTNPEPIDNGSDSQPIITTARDTGRISVTPLLGKGQQ